MKNDEDDNHREDKCLPEKSLDWCGGGDLNPYALRRKHLKLVRLPISPPPQLHFVSISEGRVVCRPCELRELEPRLTALWPGKPSCRAGVFRLHRTNTWR